MERQEVVGIFHAKRVILRSSVYSLTIAQGKGGNRDCHAQYATLSERNSKVPPMIDPRIETLLQGGYHYINIT